MSWISSSSLLMAAIPSSISFLAIEPLPIYDLIEVKLFNAG
jgi:hypothetical protein